MKLRRRHSITQAADFQRIRKLGRSKTGRFVIVSIYKDPTLKHLRSAFVTSKRSARKAHDRVFIRRRLRAILQRHAESFDSTAIYIVTIARSAAATASFEELEADWIKQCQRLKVLPAAKQLNRPPLNSDL